MTHLNHISKLVESIGYTLDAEQLHIQGERYLMQKEKLVLTGRRMADSKRVVIKASLSSSGKAEIQTEKKIRDLLSKMAFANGNILLPQELYFNSTGEYLLWITEFIEQEQVFVAQGIEEQFFLLLRALGDQEAFHATTFEHLQSIGHSFEVFNGRDYIENFKKFKAKVGSNAQNQNILAAMNTALMLLENNKQTMDKFSNYLTHTDFVPHNFRVQNGSMYMLDVSSVHFGNKYESWARVLNYMVIHNPNLERLLSEYVRKNRGEEEYLNLRLMRLYKLGFLLNFYTESLAKTEGDLKELTLQRIAFWHEILTFILEDKEVPAGFVEAYKAKRDDLRSEDEKKRQREFAVA